MWYFINGKEEKKERINILIITMMLIIKINGYKFCYEKKNTYKELLYNNQIIKKSENCKDNYKDCGIIDTLEQKLCIKQDEECPLYDVRIKTNEDNFNDVNYDTDSSKNSNIYYNNQNYYNNIIEKKIIGKLILNHGQPCYHLDEKLRKKFNDEEIADEKLKCESEIFGKLTDEKYEELGQISYNKLYQDNLPNNKCKDLFKDIGNTDKVSLYKREFLGIDKECDKKSTYLEDLKKLQKSQKQEKILLLVIPIILLVLWLCISFIYKLIYFSENYLVMIMHIINFLCLLTSIICSSIFLKNMVQLYNISYECSDLITNEAIKNDNSNTKRQIIYTSVNLGLDVLVLIPLIIIFFIQYLLEGITSYFEECKDKFFSLFASKNKTSNNNKNDSPEEDKISAENMVKYNQTD